MTDSVLLIHDDPGVLRTIGGRFEQAGCEGLRELNGEAGLATLDRGLPHVVCLAMHLAEASPELVRRLSGFEAQVIAFGDRPDPAAGAVVLRAGASRVADTGADAELLLTLAQRGATEGRGRRGADALRSEERRGGEGG